MHVLNKLRNAKARFRKKALMTLVLAMLILAPVIPTFAQTPVPLVVPTNEIFSQTNSWMVTFAPVQAIGIGMALALAILGFIGATILAAFKFKKN